MRGIIICGGNVGEYIKDYIKPDDFIICADSGYDRAKKFGINPDIVLGDMDSTGFSEMSEEKILYPVRKDYTDSELACQYASKKGFEEVLMFGMIGTRMDHTLANISLLSQIKNARIIDENNEIYLVDDEITFSGRKGDIVSIIPFSGDVLVKSSKGLDYPLKNTLIKKGTSLGVSNEMTENECRIIVEKGQAFIIRSKD